MDELSASVAPTLSLALRTIPFCLENLETRRLRFLSEGLAADFGDRVQEVLYQERFSQVG